VSSTYNPREDSNEYVLTGLLDNIENSAIGSWNWLQEKMEDDPNSWDDDVWRFMGQRLGGALLGAGVGSFGGPKGTLVGGVLGGVLGAERSAAILGNIPGMQQLAAAQDKLAGGARELNEKLTPWLDPRVAGWGTRALTDWAFERGARSSINKAVLSGKNKYYKHFPLDMDEAMKAGAKFDPKIMPEQYFPQDELGIQLMAQLKTTPEDFVERIKLDKPLAKGRQGGDYSIEELDLAQRGPGLEASSPYNLEIRRRVERVDKTLGVLLQERYGGTNEQVIEFLKAQKDGIKKVNESVAYLNKKQRKFTKSWIKSQIANGQLVLTNAELKDLFKQIDKKVYYNFGHLRSAKNVFRYEKLFGANRVTNVFPEIEPNVEWYSTTTGKRIKIVELGNKARKARTDAPDDILTMTGTSKTIDEEYLKFIDPTINEIAFDLLPAGQQDNLLAEIRRKWARFKSAGYPEFSEYLQEVHGISWAQFDKLPKTGVWADLRNHYRKLFNAQKESIIGKQQFDTFRPFLRKEVDKFVLSVEMQKEIRKLFKDGKVKQALELMYERSKLQD
jgi:hypothetical protein